MSLPRPEIITLLCDEAFRAMQAQAVNTTPDEAFSACFSIAMQATRTAIRMGGNLESIRQALGQIYAELPAEPTH